MLTEREQKLIGWAFTLAIVRTAETCRAMPAGVSAREGATELERAIFTDPAWKEKLVSEARKAGF